MKVTREETPDRQVVLHIEVDESRLEDHMRRASQQAAQRTNIPGFRRGKAPYRIVERFVGRDYLLDQALDSLAPAVVYEAIEDLKIEPFARPAVTIVQKEPQVKLDATIALSPEVKLGDYKAISFDDKPEPVTDADVEDSLEGIRDLHATWEPVERSLEDGDLAIINARASVDGMQFIDAASVEFELNDGVPLPAPGFSNALVGMQSGDTRNFRLRMDKEHSNPGIANKDADFTVTVLDVKQKNLPPKDDELAKSADGESETLDQLRASLREDLESRAERELVSSLQDRVMEALIEGAEIKIAPTLVKLETDRALINRRDSFEGQGYSFERHVHTTGMTVKEYVDQLEREVTRRMQQELVADELANAENVEVTEEELSEELQRPIWNRPEVKDLDGQQLRGTVKRIMLRSKALNLAVEMARAEKSPLWTPADANQPQAGRPEGNRIITLDT